MKAGVRHVENHVYCLHLPCVTDRSTPSIVHYETAGELRPAADSAMPRMFDGMNCPRDFNRENHSPSTRTEATRH
jgi:hypothetical protein